ncbi:MAG: hypothetical protein ACPGVU_05305 [Limisphaerales bacterium]
MLKHLPLALITIFWLVMNVQLYRKDFQAADIAGGKVPMNLVWTKMLRSADDSFLYIFHGKKRLGDFRWSTDVVDFIAQNPDELEDDAEIDLTEEDTIFMTDGMVLSPGNYNVEIRSGRINLREYGTVNFEMLANFSTNNTWSSFELTLRQRRKLVQFTANATNETITVTMNADGSEFLRELTFDDARSPQKLAAAMLGDSPVMGFAGGLLAGLSTPETQQSFGLDQMVKLAMNSLEARQDWLHVGHSRLRVYRISIRLPNQEEIAIQISRAGEIMRVKMPNGIELRNNRLILL